MKQAYVGVAVLFVVGLLTSGMFLLLSHLASAYRPSTVKAMPYESGIDPLGDTRERYSVKFYIVAMLFIIFDIETIFLFPWAVTFRELGMFGLLEMGVFILLVFVAYIYVWRKGGLDWGKPVQRRVAPSTKTSASEVARAS